jgi:hypothetical protein
MQPYTCSASLVRLVQGTNTNILRYSFIVNYPHFGTERDKYRKKAFESCGSITGLAHLWEGNVLYRQ